MKTLKFFLVALLLFSITPWVSIPTSACDGHVQTQGSTALERGYRTGYSDGYNSGFKDMTDRTTRDYRSKDDYQHADRAYVDAWGPIEDYRDGYQQGFEAGYASGYDRRPFASEVPAGFKRRGATASQQGSISDPVAPADPSQTLPATGSGNMNGAVRIPSDTTLIVELQSPLSTDVSQRGDQFQARVVEPDRKSTRLNSSHSDRSRMPSSA